MENFVENGLELGNYIVTKHWDKGWDRYQKFVNGKKVESVYEPYEPSKEQVARKTPSASSSSSSSSPHHRTGLESAPNLTAEPVRSPDFLTDRAARGAALYPPLTGFPGAVTIAQGPEDGRGSTYYSQVEASRRRQRNQLPSPDRDISKDNTRDTTTIIQREEAYSKQVRRQYRDETDDPRRPPADVLPEKYLWTLDDTTDHKKLSLLGPASKRESILKVSETSKRDSAIMASGYNDNYYGNTQYQGESRARSAQPAKSRYYDDEDSDYDERSGKRSSGRGRGWDDRYDDRDYDRVEEVTETYRGPARSGPVDRPYTAQRGDSYRSGNDYAVTQYGRRSDGALDRQDRESYVSRRSKSRGRSDRDRSYSRSRSRSRSRSGEGERGEGFGGKIGEHFDTTGRGLGVGLAGAVIGGLAGRQFGQRHQQRDILIGAVVGGLGANLAEHKYREWREEKRDKEESWEQRYDGRSRSNVR